MRKGNIDILPPVAFIFTIIFIFTWAGGIWLVPKGVRVWSMDWLPFFMVGFVITLALMTMLPPNVGNAAPTVKLVNKDEEKQAKKETVKTLNIFFWIMILVLALAITVRYVA